MRARELILVTLACTMTTAIADADNPYPKMADVQQYWASSKADEIALAKSAAPASVADHAEVLVLGEHGDETA